MPVIALFGHCGTVATAAGFGHDTDPQNNPAAIGATQRGMQIGHKSLNYEPAAK